MQIRAWRSHDSQSSLACWAESSSPWSSLGFVPLLCGHALGSTRRLLGLQKRESSEQQIQSLTSERMMRVESQRAEAAQHEQRAVNAFQPPLPWLPPRRCRGPLATIKHDASARKTSESEVRNMKLTQPRAGSLLQCWASPRVRAPVSCETHSSTPRAWLRISSSISLPRQ